MANHRGGALHVILWDLPTRLFHWALAVLITASITTGLLGGFDEMEIHKLSGYSILALLLFRILWGIAGSRHSRFVSFVPSPGKLVRYIPGRSAVGEIGPGHNPLGALSIVAMLIVILAQVGTGLFAYDDIMTEGPLATIVSYDTSRWLTGLHKDNVWILGGLITLHILAILFYTFVRKESLIRPMITGKKTDLTPDNPAPAHWSLALAIALLAASTVWLVVTYN